MPVLFFNLMQRQAKLLLGCILGVLLLTGSVIALAIATLTNVPDFTEMRSKVEVPIILANGDKSTKWVGPKAPGWVPLSQIANELLMAVIASEDTSFYSHDGVDYHELKEAIKKDIQEKRWARGASTI